MSGRRQLCRRAAPPSGRRDSNPRPSPWQGDALPAEPRPHASPEDSPGHPPDLSGAASELYPILAQPPTQNPRLEKKSASLTIPGYSCPTIPPGQPPTRTPGSPANRQAADAKAPGGGTYIARTVAITSPGPRASTGGLFPARYGGTGREAGLPATPGAAGR